MYLPQSVALGCRLRCVEMYYMSDAYFIKKTKGAKLRPWRKMYGQQLNFWTQSAILDKDFITQRTKTNKVSQTKRSVEDVIFWGIISIANNLSITIIYYSIWPQYSETSLIYYSNICSGFEATMLKIHIRYLLPASLLDTLIHMDKRSKNSLCIFSWISSTQLEDIETEDLKECTRYEMHIIMS